MLEEFKAQFTAENRRFPRVNIKLSAKYAVMAKGKMPNPFKGTVADMGAGGMAMISTTPLEKGQLITIKLSLPPINMETPTGILHEINDEKCDPVTFLSKVVWCNHEGDEYIVGLQMCDIDVKNKKRFKHFLVDFDLDQPTKRG